MERLLPPLLAALALPTSVNANVDAEVHKKCLEARDYAGCHLIVIKKKELQFKFLNETLTTCTYLINE